MKRLRTITSAHRNEHNAGNRRNRNFGRPIISSRFFSAFTVTGRTSVMGTLVRLSGQTLGWRRIMSAKASADSSSKRPPRCRSSFIYRWDQKWMPRESCSILTGVCVGVGTIAFFVLFQRGGPLSAVPVIFAVGVAMMAIAGILFFREPAFWQRLAGIIWQ